MALDAYSGHGPVVIDLETSVIPNVAQFMGHIKAPPNYKKDEAIQKYLEEAAVKEAEKAALDVDLCRIACVCFWDLGNDGQTAPLGWVARNEQDEAKMLANVAKLLIHPTFGPKDLIVFNGLDFDLVALMRRALYLRVKFPKIEVDRFRHRHVIDLMQELTYNGKLKYRGLEWYCNRAGIEVEDPISGKDVPALIVGGDYDSVLSHCKADILRTKGLAEWMGVIDRKVA